MSASAAAEATASAVPALSRARLPVSAPPPTKSGMATVGAISGGLVSTRSISQGKRPKTSSGIAGW